MPDLIIRNEAADIAIEDGTIIAVGPELGLTAKREVDARGLLILPGVFDVHAHCNKPVRTYRLETWRHA